MNSSLAASFIASPHSSDLEAYWIRIEQVEEESDEMSLSEAADLIDAAFNLSPCDDDGSMSGGGEQAAEPESEEESEAPASVAYEAFNFLLRDKMHFSGCRVAADGSYEAQIKVYRSHQHETYELNVTGGEVLDELTVQVQEQVSENLAVNGRSVTCEFPVAGDVSVSGGTVVSVKGSTINFAEEVAGRVVINHLTQYDLVTILIHPDPDEPGEPMDCTVFGFFHGTADDETISPPPVDEEMTADEKAAWCPNIKIVMGEPGEMTCYEYQTHAVNCRCSGERASYQTKEVQVDCPEGLQCPTGSDCRQFLASKYMVTAYAACPGEEGKDACGSRDYVTAICCGYTPPNIPPCCEVRSVYRGGAEIENGPDYYKAIYGEAVRMVALMPEDGICGDQVDRYEAPGDCCDGVPELVYNEDSVDILPDYYSGIIYWEGGGGEYTVRLDGHGFYIDIERKHHIVTLDKDARGLVIYTGDACGACRVIIEDSCGQEVEGIILSTDGNWNLKGDVKMNEVETAEAIGGTTYYGDTSTQGQTYGPIVQIIGDKAMGPDLTFNPDDTEEWYLGRWVVTCPPLSYDVPYVAAQDPVWGIFDTYELKTKVMNTQFNICGTATEYSQYGFKWRQFGGGTSTVGFFQWEC